MDAIKGIATVLIVMGLAGLAYGGFTYTKDAHTAQLGSISLTVKNQQTVNVPVWGGVAAIVIGAGLLLMPMRKA